MLACFQKDGGMMNWPRKKTLELESKSLMEGMTNIRMSLNKRKIHNIVLSKRRKEFVSRTFCKGKIQLMKPVSQMIKTDIGRLFNISDPSNLKLRLH